MKYSFFIILLIILALNSFAQVQQEWVRTYNNENNSGDFPVKIGIDSLGNILTLGSSYLQNSPDKIILIKYSKTGDTIWSRNFSSISNSSDEPKSMAIDRNSNIYISTINSNKLLTIKIDSAGHFVWLNKITIGNFGQNASIDLDINMNVYVAGDCTGGIVILKYGANGVLIWQKKILDIDIGSFQFLRMDKSSNAIITYYKYLAFDDIVTVKFSSNGDSLWAKIYNSGNYDHPYNIDIDNNNNIYVLGDCDGSPFSYNFYRLVTIKYDSTGSELWVRKYGSNGIGRNLPVSVKVDKFGSVFVAGSVFYSSSNSDFALIKYNSFGDSIWLASYNDLGNDSDFVSSMIIDEFSNVYLLGYSKNTDFSYRLTTVKYDINGMLIWGQHQNSYLYTSAIPNASIVIDTNNNVYVFGGLWSSANAIDLMTIKYSQVIGISPISTEVPQKFLLHQNYPNPFNPSTKIRFSIPLLRGVSEGRGVLTSLLVYDILGRVVRMVVSENLKAGIYEVEFNTIELPSGVYFYKLSAGEFVDTKKMILLK